MTAGVGGVVVVIAAIALVYFCVKKAKAGQQPRAPGKRATYESGVDATAAAVSVMSVSATEHMVDVAESSGAGGAGNRQGEMESVQGIELEWLSAAKGGGAPDEFEETKI